MSKERHGQPPVYVCAHCAEYWPCSVEANRKAYRPDVSSSHRPVAVEALSTETLESALMSSED